MTTAVFYDTDFASKERWWLFLKLLGLELDGQAAPAAFLQGREFGKDERPVFSTRVEIVEFDFDEKFLKINPAELIEGKFIRL